MRHGLLLTTATIAATILSTGCMRSQTASTFRPDVTSVSVRFVLPSEQERYSGVDTQADAQLAADPSPERYSQWNEGFETAATSSGPYHAALWGGPYDGVDVTTQPTALPPGSYTFALFDQPNETAMQGWLDIRNTGSDLVSVLNKWKDSIAEQKRQMAYELEIDGRMRVNDPDVFKSFKKQMQAYNRLERQLENSIKAEYRSETANQRERRDLLRNVDVVIMPGEDPFFSPTTQPAFTESDLEAIRTGEVVTKIVLTADYTEAQWKLARLNRLYEDLARFREVLRQEADRLERHKEWLRITDHLYNHGERFVENEIQLQHTLGLIDRFRSHALDLRERRMALAFITSLFTPGADFTALDQEERDLFRERNVLEIERQHVDRLFNDTDVGNEDRIVLERRRQDVMATVDAVNNQIDDIQQARTTLAAMVDATTVIHRHNDTRLLTTTLLADQLPPGILRVVEREAMMTVRLQETDEVSVPRPASLARYKVDSRPTYSSATFSNQRNQGSSQDTNKNTNDFDQVEPTRSHQTAQTDFDRTERTKSDRTERKGFDRTDRTDSDRTERTDFDREEPTDVQHSKAGCTDSDPEKTGCPWYVRMVCPPCWFDSSACDADYNDARTTYSSTVFSNQSDKGSSQDTSKNTNDFDQVEQTDVQHNETGCADSDAEKTGCPWYVRLVCPPCWFDSSACDADYNNAGSNDTDWNNAGSNNADWNDQ